ncbi:hypothetical protein Goarm_002272 [Gossypium armourianum]|uniref:Uncharacterized protein n=1 Tax=Gossypium armourianum TaxID=34283 RepID=A0A7J9K7L8_9ROSI|nr:hypothetical protein [Gossypium armourianum]
MGNGIISTVFIQPQSTSLSFISQPIWTH